MHLDLILFFIPKLFKKQQKELVKQISNKIEELLIEYKDTGKEYYNKTVLMLREALESIRNKKFEEACNILYDFDIKIKF